MSVARYIPLTVLLGVGLLAVNSVTINVEVPTATSARFDAGDFYRFRTRYRELLNLPAQTRVELIQGVAHACTQSSMAPSVLDKILNFSQTVADSNLETKEVREAARGLSELVAAKKLAASELAAREPAALQNKP